MTGSDSNLTLPVTVAPSRIASGGSLSPTLTSNVRVTGSACGATSRTRPVAVTLGSSVSRTVICGIARRRAEQLRRHVEDGIAPALAGEPNDHLPRLHHLARFRASGRHRSGRVRLKGRPADAIPGDLQLSFRVIDLGLRTLQRVLRLVEPGSGCVAVRQQLSLSFEMAARVGQLSLRGGEGGFRRAQLIELVLRVEFGKHLSRLDPVADIDRSFDHPPADAKGERRLVFGLDVPGQHHGFAGLRFGSGHGSHGAYLGRRLSCPACTTPAPARWPAPAKRSRSGRDLAPKHLLSLRTRGSGRASNRYRAYRKSPHVVACTLLRA